MCTLMTKNCEPPNGQGDQHRHPDYAAMAKTLETVAGELAARAAAEGDHALAAQSRRLLQLAAAIRSDSVNSR